MSFKGSHDLILFIVMESVIPPTELTDAFSVPNPGYESKAFLVSNKGCFDVERKVTEKTYGGTYVPRECYDVCDKKNFNYRVEHRKYWTNGCQSDEQFDRQVADALREIQIVSGFCRYGASEPSSWGLVVKTYPKTALSFDCLLNVISFLKRVHDTLDVQYWTEKVSLQGFECLERLNLRGVSVFSEEDLVFLLRMAPNIKELDLRGCNLCKEQDFDSLSTSELPALSLKRIYLSGGTVSSVFFKKLIEAAVELEYLSLPLQLEIDPEQVLGGLRYTNTISFHTGRNEGGDFRSFIKFFEKLDPLYTYPEASYVEVDLLPGCMIVSDSLGDDSRNCLDGESLVEHFLKDGNASPYRHLLLKKGV